MKENFEHFWKFLKFWEKEYVNNPFDPGGLTIYGISKKSHPQLVDELDELYRKGLKQELETKARKYTKMLYWDNLGCDNLQNGVDIVIADTAFLQGESIAKKIIKDLTIFQMDFNLDEKYLYTVAIIKRFDYLDDVRPILYERFGRGWSKRILSLYDYISSGYKEIKYD